MWDHEMLFNDLAPGELTFTTLKDWKGDIAYNYVQKGKNYKVKYPIRAFTRYPNDVYSLEGECIKWNFFKTVTTTI